MRRDNYELKLFIILLENNKWLLHVSRETDPNILFLECEIIYKYAKKNRPIKIKSIRIIDNILEIDFYVKQYMFEYGIDNVRGGSYQDEILGEHFIKTLNHELSIHISTFDNNLQFFKEIYEKYKNINDTTILEFEYNKISNQVRQYGITKYYLELVKYYCFINNSNNINDEEESYQTNIVIDRTYLEDIEWIKQKIMEWKHQYIENSIQRYTNEENIQTDFNTYQHSKDDERKYDFIMNKFKVLNIIYRKVFEKNISEKNKIYETPNDIFDIFF